MASPVKHATNPGHGKAAHLTVVGGGLAGSEAAWQAAELGVDVTLYEMRPDRQTPVHVGADLAELVCSNSLGSNMPDRAGGLLKQELRLLGSLLVGVADATALPAGGALAVDRDAFAAGVSAAVAGHPRITVIRREMVQVPPGPTVIATGPLTSAALTDDLTVLTGRAHLHFYDALAPIVTASSIDMSIAFRGSRYGRGMTEAGDYINCPLTEPEFDAFAGALLAADRIPLRDFEVGDGAFFEACLPVEVIAARGPRALLFGPMRPVGLRDPRTGRRPFAVVQLRQDNAAAELYNLVGFQTNLRWPEQRRVLALIPGLAEAEFVRFGQMHRNTFLDAPQLLAPDLSSRARDDLWFAGQLIGSEGYAGSIATGLVVGQAAARRLLGLPPLKLPPTTMVGALCRYLTEADPADFQPMKANFGLLPPLVEGTRGRTDRRRAFAERALAALEAARAEALPDVQDTVRAEAPDPARADAADAARADAPDWPRTVVGDAAQADVRGPARAGAADAVWACAAQPVWAEPASPTVSTGARSRCANGGSDP